MKKIAKFLCITMIASTIFFGCGKQQPVETETLEPVEEASNEVDAESTEESEDETSDVATIESYYNDHPEELQTIIDNMANSENNVYIEISGNTVTVKYVLNKEYSASELEAYTQQTIANAESEEMKNSYEEAKGIFSANSSISNEDIVIEVIYFDSERNELTKATY